MSNLQDITDDKNRPGEEDVQQEKTKSNVFVNTTALVTDRVIPLYSVLESQSTQLRNSWLTLLGVAIFCVWVISFTYTVLISERPIPRGYRFSPPRTIFLIGLASHALVLVISFLIDSIFDVLSWALISGAKGAPLRTFLVTSKNTGLSDVGKHSLKGGPHQKWSILRFFVVAIGWVIGPLLLRQLRTENFYQSETPFQVVAGIALFNESVAALEKSNSISSTAVLDEAAINEIILGSSKGILNDPGFAVPISPVKCNGPDCRSIFLPGGMQLVRLRDGSAISTHKSNSSVLVVNDAPGIQVEFSSSNHVFNRTTECTQFGLPFSSLYSCMAFVNNTIQSAITVCPLANVETFSCHSNLSWTDKFDANVTLSLYQRTATVAYDNSNFSVISVLKISEPIDVTNNDLQADFQKMFRIMYPVIIDIGDVLPTLLGGTQAFLSDLYYWASAYCVQSELVSAQEFYHHGFPTWITSERDILEGFLTLPLQFSTLLWQYTQLKNLSVLPHGLQVTAATATVSQRVRSDPGTIAIFAAFILALVVWAIICLTYAQIQHRMNIQENDPVIEAAFQRENPFDVDESIWTSLWEILVWVCCCGKSSKTKETRNEKEVIARRVGEKKMSIAVAMGDS